MSNFIKLLTQAYQATLAGSKPHRVKALAALLGVLIITEFILKLTVL